MRLRFTQTMLLLGVILLTGGLATRPAKAGEGDRHTILDEACGIEVVLPAANWTLTDQSQGGAVIHIYSPIMPPVPRFTLLRLPAAALPEGLKSRANQLKGLVKADIPVTSGAIGGEQAERIEYLHQGTRSVEYGLKRGENFLVVQVVAKESEWADPATGPALEGIFTSLVFKAEPGTVAALIIDPATPAEVRAARQTNSPAKAAFSIRSHDVTVVVDPAEHRLQSRDRFEIEVLADETSSLLLHATHLTIDGLTVDGQEVKWVAEGDSSVRVSLPAPAKTGQRLHLSYSAHADDYFYSVEQQLVAEVAMLGQVRPGSTFSSHVLYYPIDARNDAPVKLALDVPAGMVAVSGGEAKAVETHDGRSIYRFEMSARMPRLLPLGFAVGAYKELTARTPGGLELAIYHFAEAETPAKQRLDIAVRAGTLFERLMGPLPWRRVAFCQVRPEKKETGVSLPGLVLVSDGFFADLSGVSLRGEALNDPSVLGALLVVDELAHQWNAYATPLPNELAEGVSTFSNLLFIETTVNPEEYVAGVRFCNRAYLMGVAMFGDVPLAHPKLYASNCYRTVAFTKPAVVLHMLRRRLGDDLFFRGWREAFASIHEPTEAYAAFLAAFEKVSGEDLDKFFDDWFFRAGIPEVEMQWANRTSGSATQLEVVMRQVQKLEPYDLGVEVEFRTQSGQTFRKWVRADGRETRSTFDLDSPAESVRVDPDSLAPIRLHEVSKPAAATDAKP